MGKKNYKKNADKPIGIAYKMFDDGKHDELLLYIATLEKSSKLPLSEDLIKLKARCFLEKNAWEEALKIYQDSFEQNNSVTFVLGMIYCYEKGAELAEFSDQKKYRDCLQQIIVQCQRFLGFKENEISNKNSKKIFNNSVSVKGKIALVNTKLSESVTPISQKKELSIDIHNTDQVHEMARGLFNNGNPKEALNLILELEKHVITVPHEFTLLKAMCYQVQGMHRDAIQTCESSPRFKRQPFLQQAVSKNYYEMAHLAKPNSEKRRIYLLAAINYAEQILRMPSIQKASDEIEDIKKHIILDLTTYHEELGDYAAAIKACERFSNYKTRYLPLSIMARLYLCRAQQENPHNLAYAKEALNLCREIIRQQFPGENKQKINDLIKACHKILTPNAAVLIKTGANEFRVKLTTPLADELEKSYSDLRPFLKKDGTELLLLTGSCVRQLLSANPFNSDVDWFTTMPADTLRAISYHEDTHHSHYKLRLFQKTLFLSSTVNNKVLEQSISVDVSQREDDHSVSRQHFLESEASSRDFSIGSLFYDVEKNILYDSTGHGIDDALAGILRTNGDPKKRLRQDVSIILRALHFEAQGFVLVQELVLALNSFQLDKPMLDSDREHLYVLLRKYLAINLEKGMTAADYQTYKKYLGLLQKYNVAKNLFSFESWEKLEVVINEWLIKKSSKKNSLLKQGFTVMPGVRNDRTHVPSASLPSRKNQTTFDGASTFAILSLLPVEETKVEKEPQHEKSKNDNAVKASLPSPSKSVPTNPKSKPKSSSSQPKPSTPELSESKVANNYNSARLFAVSASAAIAIGLSVVCMKIIL